MLCGIVGLFWRVLVGRQSWLAMGLGTATAISLMELMSLAYPPGVGLKCKHDCPRVYVPSHLCAQHVQSFLCA